MVIGIDIRLLARGIQTGIQEYTVNLLNHLLPLDKSVKYKLFYNAFKKRKLDFPWLSLPNVKLYQFSLPNRFLQISSFLFSSPRIDRLIEGCDVFFSPHFILAPVSKNCKKIITFHDLSFEYYSEFFSFQQKVWHLLMKPEDQAKEANKIIAVSESTKEDLINLYQVDPEKIRVIYSGIDENTKYQISCTNSLAKRNGLSNTKSEIQISKVIEKYNLPEKFILYFGTIEPRKNLIGLIRAFELLKTYQPKHLLAYKLVIAGSPGWLYKDIYKIARKSKFAKEILLIGFVDREDKPFLYSLASVFVYPSFFEGFGFPPLEAMVQGLPTIVSNTTSLPEIAGDGALLVDPYNINEIARAMKMVLEDEKLRNRLKEKGLVQAKKFSWQKCAEETFETIQSITNQDFIEAKKIRHSQY